MPRNEVILLSEALTEDQVVFLQKRYDAEIKKFKRARNATLKFGSIAGIIFSTIFFLLNKLAPIEEYAENQERMSDGTAILIGFLCTLGLIGIILTAFVIAYFANFRSIKMDMEESTKLIEIAHIKEKKFMPHNETYHFILDSPTRYSMEVDATDFQFYALGDEINLEYTTHSKIDLGYF